MSLKKRKNILKTSFSELIYNPNTVYNPKYYNILTKYIIQLKCGMKTLLALLKI